MKYSAAIVTISDSCFSKKREDISGDVIKNILESNNFEIAEISIIPDEQEEIVNTLTKHTNGDINLIITTGGTGFSPRDITPEATKMVIEREAPGVSEAIRAYGMQYSTHSMLSRGICGIKKNSIILNLPGSPKAVDESLTFAMPALIHALDILSLNANNCSR